MKHGLQFRKHCMSVDRGMDTADVVPVHTVEYYSAVIKNEIMPSAATWMDP